MNNQTFRSKSKAINKQMAGHLKVLRQDKKLTMRKLADQIQTAHSFIGKIEKQDRRMDVGEFILYCEAMGYDPIDVMKQIKTHSV